ncbi:DUF4394 domain-containing protein [Aquabacterium sp.]|uniref:DUF4394 domain-containing protein n=1 Tax=Aquabacterium sp. TaxID=1872578 RepID=UPI0037844BC2
MPARPERPARRRAAALLLATALGGCAVWMEDEPPANPLPQMLLGLTAGGDLVRFAAHQPQQLLERKPVIGLQPGEQLLGLDYRVSRGVLYTFSSRGQLYTLDPASGQLAAVGGPVALPLVGQQFGVDVNPVADRVRIVSDRGQNLRLHPDSGEMIDGDPLRAGAQPDPDLQFAPGDANAGRTPRVVAAAYTYNRRDDKLTTNYAIDAGLGALLTQGTAEGVQPAVSPNSGRLYTVGALGTGPLQDASFDIADTDNTALAALRSAGRTRLYRIDLASGQAILLGTIGGGQPLQGLAIIP